jgi:hypothetical protein
MPRQPFDCNTWSTGSPFYATYEFHAKREELTAGLQAFQAIFLPWFLTRRLIYRGGEVGKPKEQWSTVNDFILSLTAPRTT